MYCDTINTNSGFSAPSHTAPTPWSIMKGFMLTGPSKFYKFVRLKNKQINNQTKHGNIIWNCIPLMSWWRQLSKKCFFHTSNPSFCYWKKPFCWMTQLCLDQLFELQLRNYINESCHGFMLFSIAPNPININKSNNSHGKLAWMPQMQQKPKSNTKHWATDLWASGSSFVIPFRMPHELQTKKSRGKW